MCARDWAWLQVGGIQRNGSDRHTTPRAGRFDINDSSADADMEQDRTVDEELLRHDRHLHDEMQEDDDQADDARDMSMEPLEQSGYPADPGDEDDEENDESPSQQVDLTADSPLSRKGRSSSEVISVSDGSNNDGSENVGLHSVEPEGSINMLSAHDSTFLAAVKKQSKVKEGDWTQVRRQSNSGDYGLIDID